MVPGVYMLEFGRNGQVLGGGILVLMHNRISGADTSRCVFDGEYAFDSQGRLVVRSLRLRVPAGVALVQGIPAQGQPYYIDYPSITLDIDDEKPTEFQVPTTPFPLDARLTRLQRLDP